MKRIKKTDPLFSVFMKTYYDWYKMKVGIPPKIDGGDGRALKMIVKYLRSINDNPFVSEEEVEIQVQDNESVRENIVSDKNLETTKMWDFVFAHYEKWDRFYQKQLKLTQINSNLNNIINSIKNGKQSITEGKSVAEIRNTIGDID
jgi:hypothetical protein